MEIEIKRGVDIMRWDPDKSYDVVWAGVPCQGYSGLAYSYSRIWDADPTLWRRAEDIVKILAPRFWVIENVKMAQWIHGRAVMHYGPYFLWGWFPRFKAPKGSWQRSYKGTHFDRKGGGIRTSEDFTQEDRERYHPDFVEAAFKAISKGFTTGYQPRLWGGKGEG